MSDPKSEENREETREGFVRERIVNKTSGKRLIRRLLITGVCGVLFGLAAGVTMAAVLPKASQWFVEEETSSGVTIPRDTQDIPRPSEADMENDDPSGEAEASGESGETGESVDQTAGTPDEDGWSEEKLRAMIDEMLKKQYGEWSKDISTVEDLFYTMASLGRTYNQAVVTVVMKDRETDLFENEVETSGECAGIIWNEGEDGSLYIMSSGTIPGDGTEIQVIFNDGSRRDAVFCQADSQTGLVILKVLAANVDPDLHSRIQVLPLGNSYTVRQGDPLLIVGNTIGYVGAVVPAMVTYLDGVMYCADSAYREIYLNCASADQANGFVISLDGVIVGVVTPDTSGNVTSMLAISDLKGVLELLANGMQVPYLGITGRTVTDELRMSLGLPVGVYVADVIPGSPAYEAGIKAGDVVTSIGSLDVAAIRGMRTAVEQLTANEPVTVTVKRAGSGEYQELQFQIMPGVR